MNFRSSRVLATRLFAVAALLTCLLYWPGLQGGWFFDDYPNIVDNAEVQPAQLGTAELVAAALSSPSSDLKRPLASLSFVASFWVSGLDPFGWKLTNLVIHLLNGWLLLLLARHLFQASARNRPQSAASELDAALIASAWLLLPINLTGVLFVVQRMESLANLFVLAGLLGYVLGRRRMIDHNAGFGACALGIVLATAIGATVKETAVMLPLYAFLVEWLVFGFARHGGGSDRRLAALFAAVLLLPAVLGLAVMTPWLLDASTWSTRDFGLATRLLSEARIVIAYIGWTLLPLPQTLSFYHDHFVISDGLLSPWTTLASLLAIAALLLLAWRTRKNRPLLALGILLFFGSHLLTGSVLPLELIYEHRNYFPSFGLLLAVIPLLTAPGRAARATQLLLLVLFVWWSGLTLLTARAWSDPLKLASELALRAAQSPRAQTGLGRELLLRSGYDPQSPLLSQGMAAMERASAMPNSSILPEQALIVANALRHLPLEQRWWDRMLVKLKEHSASSEDVSALGTLVRCARKRDCELPREPMLAALETSRQLTPGDPQLLTIYSDYAWGVIGDQQLGETLASAAVDLQPGNADARIALARMNIVLRRPEKVQEQLQALERLNVAHRLDRPIADLRRLVQAGNPAN